LLPATTVETDRLLVIAGEAKACAETRISRREDATAKAATSERRVIFARLFMESSVN
jgi:hypothetical protein